MSGKEEKVKIPLSSNAGSTLASWLRVWWQNSVHPRYYFKAMLVFIVVLTGWPFRIIEGILLDRKIRNTEIKEAPLFIIGHWRSGTTHLHNLLCQDERAGYVSTYQALFPEYLKSAWLYKRIMRIIMPEKRLVDNVRLGAELPMEEEFAIANTSPYSNLHGWYFWKRMMHYFDKYILFEKTSEKERHGFKRAYMRVLKKAVIRSGKPWLILKNPPNSGRIDVILEMFPEAKFIHIHRNPVLVFFSTRKLFEKTFPSLTFHKMDINVLEERIFEVYERMMKKMFNDLESIPPGQITTVKFEDLEQNPEAEMKKVYDELNLGDWEAYRPKLSDYLESKKSYRKNEYQFPTDMVEKIENRWAFAFEKLGYKVIRDSD